MDREEAAYSLGVLARPLSDRSRVIDALKKLLKDSDEFVRLTAAESIGLLGDRTALPALQEVADKDRSEWVRQVAREAIESVNKGVSTPREGNTYWLPRMF
jgi:HEAT repeat protein